MDAATCRTRSLPDPAADSAELVTMISDSAVLAANPATAPLVRSADTNDDYLVGLASSERAVLVSGDAHLTILADRLPVRTPIDFLAALAEPPSESARADRLGYG